MKLFKYSIYLTLLFCGCADATPKEKLSEFTCPSVLPAEKDFPAAWVTMGQVPDDKLPIRDADLISGEIHEVKARLTGDEDRAFSSEMIDEWTEVDGRSEATIPYDESHGDIAMKCIYSKLRQDRIVNSRSVVLLIQLTPKKAFNCLLLRNHEGGPDYGLSCKAK